MQNQLKGAGNVCEPREVNPMHVVTLREDAAENETMSTKDQCTTIYLVRQSRH